MQPPTPGAGDYNPPAASSLLPNQFALGGKLGDRRGVRRRPQGDSTLSLRFKARRVFLVMGSPGEPRSVQVSLDGEPIADSIAGDDVSGGEVKITKQRLYRLAELPKAEDHTLTLGFDAGVEAYAFTFG